MAFWRLAARCVVTTARHHHLPARGSQGATASWEANSGEQARRRRLAADPTTLPAALLPGLHGAADKRHGGRLDTALAAK